MSLFFFFFNDTATTEIYTLSLHERSSDLISASNHSRKRREGWTSTTSSSRSANSTSDRKSTRLNSSHLGISYAVFCLKKKKHNNQHCQFKLKHVVALHIAPDHTRRLQRET